MDVIFWSIPVIGCIVVWIVIAGMLSRLSTLEKNQDIMDACITDLYDNSADGEELLSLAGGFQKTAENLSTRLEDGLQETRKDVCNLDTRVQGQIRSLHASTFSDMSVAKAELRGEINMLQSKLQAGKEAKAELEG